MEEIDYIFEHTSLKARETMFIYDHLVIVLK